MQTFMGRLKRMLNRFFRAVRLGEKTPQKLAIQYIDNTKEDIMKFDAEMLDQIEQIVTCAEIHSGWRTNEELRTKCVELQNLLKKLQELQCRQLREGICSLIASVEINARTQMEDELMRIIDATGNLDMEAMGRFWTKNKTIIQTTEQEKEVCECIKKINHVMNMYSRMCVGFSRFLSSYSAGDLRNHVFIDGLSETIYKGLINKLDDFERGRADELDMQTIGVTGTELQYVKKKIKIGGAAQIRKRLEEVFSDTQQMIIDNFIQDEINWYREATSDLFMCGIMDLSAWGYLVIVAATFVFNSKSDRAQYRRVALVVECLIQQNEKNLNQFQYTEALGGMLRREVQTLADQFNQENEGNQTYGIKSTVDIAIAADLDSRKNAREKIAALNSVTAEMLNNSEKCNSTQKWILRIYLQIGYILYNIAGRELMKEQMLTKEIWDDVTGPRSYLQQKKKLRRDLERYGGENLCKGIRDILNSPAEFFTNRKSLLYDEVRFVLEHYKNSCRSIFE